MSGSRIVRAFVFVAAAALACLAQFTTANLAGTVVDATGASVPEATVKVLNKETGFVKTDVTGSDGAFTFPALPVGTYRLTVEKAGFSTYVQEGITLTVNRVATQRVLLQVGTAMQEITVVENALMVNTQTATIGQLVSQKQVTELPLNGRGHRRWSSSPLAPSTIPAFPAFSDRAGFMEATCTLPSRWPE